MANKRRISGAKPQFGNARSFSMRATRRKFEPNMQNKWLFVPELGYSVRVRVSASELKTIDKIGLREFLKRRGLTLKHVMREDDPRRDRPTI